MNNIIVVTQEIHSNTLLALLQNQTHKYEEHNTFCRSKITINRNLIV